MEEQDSIFKNYVLRNDLQQQIKQLCENFNQEALQIVNEFKWCKQQIAELNILEQNLREKYKNQLLENIKNEEIVEKQVSLDKLNKLLSFQTNIFIVIQRLFERSLKQMIRHFTKEIQKEKQPDKKGIIEQMKIYLEQAVISSQLTPEKEQQIKNAFVIGLQIFLYALTQIPAVYIRFFEENLRNECENTDIINDQIDLNNFRSKLFDKIHQQLKDTVGKEVFSLEQINQDIIDVITVMSDLISKTFNKYAKDVQKQIEIFKTKTENIKIQNKYILTGLIKELSQQCYKSINDQLSESFLVLIEPDLFSRFILYIIQNYEEFQMFTSAQQKKRQNIFDIEGEKFSQELESQQESHKLTSRSKPNNQPDEKVVQKNLAYKLSLIASQQEKISLQEIVRKDGHTGYLIENEKGQQYVMHQNTEGEIVVLNSKFVSNTWRLSKPTSFQSSEEEEQSDQIDAQQRKDRIESIAKNKPISNFLSQHQNNGPLPETGIQKPILVGAASDIGGSLGYCLANINKYESTGEFMKDFGYNATINGSITYLVEKVPVFGTILLVGGLGYTSLKLYENQTANNKRKFGKVGKLVISTGTSIGGSIGGALIGQALIPIPIFGAFVGGFIGGLIGGTSSTIIMDAIDKQKYIQMIQKLENSMNEKGFWDFSRQNLNYFGITKKFFMKTLPEALIQKCGKDTGQYWMTINCYCVITLSYARQDEKIQAQMQKKREKREKQIEQQKLLQQQNNQQQQQQNLQKQNSNNNEYIQQNSSSQNQLLQQQNNQQNNKNQKDQIDNEEQKQQQQQNTQNSDNQQKKQHLQDTEEDDIDQQMVNADKEYTKIWPDSILKPMEFLLKQNIYIYLYLNEIQEFIKKIMTEA